ncbi:protein trichome birefringence-like [Canna indica]|uniref:Protein trichome birefringence-like n=1 Tax=Canna indica TaxID=4628 RepID=A0AAQ3KJF0_9LILI|nr:protein trichome birefringence-like [Canna indica]
MKKPETSAIASNLRSLTLSLLRNRRTKVLYGFAFAFFAFTAYVAFCPSEKASPWLSNFFTSASVSTSPYRSQISSRFSYIFRNSSASPPAHGGFRKGGFFVANRTTAGNGVPSKSGASRGNEKGGSQESGVSARKNEKVEGIGVSKGDVLEATKHTGSGIGSNGSDATKKKQTANGNRLRKDGNSTTNNEEKSANGRSMNDREKNQTTNDQGKVGVDPEKEAASKNGGDFRTLNQKKSNDAVNNGDLSVMNQNKESTSNPKKNGVAEKNQFRSGENGVSSFPGEGREKVDWITSMKDCDFSRGRWVKDESYPLYPEGSCPHIDEPFDCYGNGRPDPAYQKLRWQPSGCNIPRFNATDMLERLRGKRLVFVGDSLNRNMWESLVCALRHTIKDKSNVFEVLDRNEFRSEGSYSFVFKDFNCSVEFFSSPFLVQEWEIPRRNGRKRETLRIDIVERSSSLYKDADIIIYNTGHWWTHDKTFEGKNYYQEGSHVYRKLNVEEAFKKALTTWARWVDDNVNPKKSLVFFRGYSISHFSGGQWNSGGQCHKEMEPVGDEKFLSSYPTLMSILESVMSRMKTPVSYLNVSRMTDYRKDAHPSIYNKPNLTEEERRSPERFQDCSHWCLPGVPDSWNEILYARLLTTT